MGFSGTLALVLYWMFAISFYGVIFELGILGFIILLMGYLCVELVDSLRYKAELQVYERLSREDSMTGLQNRRSFDEYIQAMMESRQEDADAATHRHTLSLAPNSITLLRAQRLSHQGVASQHEKPNEGAGFFFLSLYFEGLFCTLSESLSGTSRPLIASAETRYVSQG